MFRLLSITLLPAALISLFGCTEIGSTGASEGGQVESRVVRSIYNQIMLIRSDYKNLPSKKKALAACINWSGTSPTTVDVRYSMAYYESEFSERAIPTGHLMNSAMRECERARNSQNLNCECVEVDRNGAPALTVPISVLQESIVWIEAPDEVGPFDGEWVGEMSCGDCENCIGPMRRDVKITVEKYRFRLQPDTSYYRGEGEIDSRGNIRIYSMPDDFYSRIRDFQFDGSYDGKAFVLQGRRGPRQCEIMLSRVE